MSTLDPEMNSLPAELIDGVIDHLYDDIMSLLKCSLVCRAWVSAARYHLWTMRMANFGGDVRSKNDRLVKLLSDPLSTLGPAVRRVCIGSISQPKDLTYLMHKIAPCRHVLHTTRSLYLRGVTWKDIDDASRVAFTSKFANLTELVLSNVKFSTCESMVRLITSFPLLQRLYFVRVQWGASTSYSATRLVLPRLRTLQVDYGCQDVIDWLSLSRDDFSSLQALHLKLSEIEPSNGGFLPAFAPSLEHFEIAFYKLYLESLPSFDVELNRNTELRSIHISHLQLNELGLSGADPLRHKLYVGWVPKILSSVVSPHIQQVRFSIWVSNVTDVDLIDWRCLGQVFGRPQFLVMDTVLLDMYGKMYMSGDRVALESRVRTALGGSRAANLLQFHWH